METYRAYLQAHAGAALELLLPEDFGLEPVPETNLWEGM